MGCITNLNTVAASESSYLKTRKEIKARAPKTSSGDLVYSMDKVSGFLVGTTFESQQTIKNILFI